MFTANRLATATTNFRGTMIRSQTAFGNMLLGQPSTRIFSSVPPTVSNAPGFADVSDVLKVDYTEEFDQGLTDE